MHMSMVTQSHVSGRRHATPDARCRELRLWLPPARLRRYALMKHLAAAGFAAIFLGWMLLQWSNPIMRCGAAALGLATVWITVRSSLAERGRTAGRQVELIDRTLRITMPDSNVRLRLADVAHGRWRDDAGLSLHDRDGRLLGLIDTGCIADETEARTFLHWLRDRAGISLRVHWSDTPTDIERDPQPPMPTRQTVQG